MRGREGVRALTEPLTNPRHLAAMMGCVSLHHQLVESDPEAADIYWQLQSARFKTQYGYTERKFDWLCWEADMLLNGIGTIDQELEHGELLI
jgi:hypothetical protein